MIEAFFQALSPVELDVYTEALEKQNEIEEKIEQAYEQQVEEGSAYGKNS